MHNAGFDALGLDWRYLACDVFPENLAQALAGAAHMHFHGVNLTVPHKLLAVPMMDRLEESAVKWGAVNTVVFEGCTETGSWQPLREFEGDMPLEVRSVGHNTDGDGLALALREDLNFQCEGARVLLLGAGGAGRVAALLLAEAGVGELFLHNRTAAKAEAIAAELRERHPAVQVVVGYPHREVDLVLNATSLGLRASDPLPLDLDRFPLTDTRAVYDMVYRPARTALLERARGAGCHTANGLGMLLHQGTRAFELWTGQAAPVEVMRAALHAEVYGS
jgi:shikimate dehydrogenase